jgi:hypothetical protein
MNIETVDWLLEPQDAGVRYLALRDLLHRGPDDPELMAAAKDAHQSEPIQTVLDAMQPEGYWEKPGPGYGPKYKSTVWAVTLLAQLGANVAYDERVQTACEYVLEHSLTDDGRFTYNERPYGTFDCLQGNLCWALLSLGCRDNRIMEAIDWAARSQTGDGIAPVGDRKAPLHYTVYKCGPRFACAANGRFPCAWGSVKILLALGMVPQAERSEIVNEAIELGINFLLSVDPATAAYPTTDGKAPNRSWWKFGFPVFYITDVLQLAEMFASLGLKNDERVSHLVDQILSKRDSQGRWLMEYAYGSKTWGSYGRMKQPNKWVTLRALRAMQGLAPDAI